MSEEEFDSSISPFIILFHTIEWNSTFMKSLLVFHIIWLAFVFYSLISKHLRGFVALASAAVAYSSQYINNYFSNHYKDLGLTINVFDPSGLFVFIFIAVPLSFYLFVIVISYMKELIDALAMSIKYKKMYQAKQNKQKDE